MLYLIGGAARSGKTLLAHRLLRERGVPHFCVDYFVSALDQGAPELGIQGESPTEPKTKKLWPRLVPMLRNIVEVEPAYTVEGDALSPRGVSEQIQAYPGQIRAAFVGYGSTTAERKLAEIRTAAGGVNDWIQDHTDEYILALCSEMIEFSRFVQAECQSLGLPYFDVSDDFQQGLDKAYASLTA
jgi:hypothetical protein